MSAAVQYGAWLWVGHNSGWADTVCILVFFLAIFDKLRSASTPDARPRLRVLAAGCALSFGPVLIMFGILPFFGYNPHNAPLFEFSLPFLVVFPLILAYVLIVQTRDACASSAAWAPGTRWRRGRFTSSRFSSQRPSYGCR